MSAVTSRAPAARASGGKDGVLAEIFGKSLTTLPQLHGPSRCLLWMRGLKLSVAEKTSSIVIK